MISVCGSARFGSGASLRGRPGECSGAGTGAERASIKFGLYDLNSEFDAIEAAALFINPSHGIGPDFSQSGRNGPSIFPLTSLALRADYKLDDHWLVRAVILDAFQVIPSVPCALRSSSALRTEPWERSN